MGIPCRDTMLFSLLILKINSQNNLEKQQIKAKGNRFK